MTKLFWSQFLEQLEIRIVQSNIDFLHSCQNCLQFKKKKKKSLMELWREE